MKVKRLGVVRYSDDLIGSGAMIALIKKQVPERIFPEGVLPLTASHAVSSVFHILATRTDLLHAEEIRYV